MTKGKKTTQQERAEIVAFCLEHGKDDLLTEKMMHWLLGVHFGEDCLRVANQSIQENMNMLCKFALSLTMIPSKKYLNVTPKLIYEIRTKIAASRAAKHAAQAAARAATDDDFFAKQEKMRRRRPRNVQRKMLKDSQKLVKKLESQD